MIRVNRGCLVGRWKAPAAGLIAFPGNCTGRFWVRLLHKPGGAKSLTWRTRHTIMRLYQVSYALFTREAQSRLASTAAGAQAAQDSVCLSR